MNKSIITLDPEEGREGLATAVGVGYTIFAGIADNKGDIHWNLAEMEGAKYPSDNKTYHNKGRWREKRQTVKGKATVAFFDELSATFRVNYWYNGHAVGFVGIDPINTNDAPFWGINVKARIKVDPTTYKGNIAAIFVTFNYEFNHSIRDSKFYIRRLKLYGNGFVRRSGGWQ